MFDILCLAIDFNSNDRVYLCVCVFPSYFSFQFDFNNDYRLLSKFFTKQFPIHTHTYIFISLHTNICIYQYLCTYINKIETKLSMNNLNLTSERKTKISTNFPMCINIQQQQQ